MRALRETRLRPTPSKIELGVAAALEPTETAADASGSVGGAGAPAEDKSKETAASARRSRTPVMLSDEDALGPDKEDRGGAAEGWSPEEATVAREIS